MPGLRTGHFGFRKGRGFTTGKTSQRKGSQPEPRNALLQHFGQEVLGALMLWIVKDLGGRAGFDDLAVIHQNHLI